MKKVLLITYYWPPAGGPGVQRALYFVKYLRDFGWEPIVYTVDNGEFHNEDHSFEKEIPRGVTVLKKQALEPYAVYKKLLGKKNNERLKPVVFTEKTNKPVIHNMSVWIRGNFFIPDARMLWIKPSVQYLTAYLKDHPVDAIISTSPPQSVHMIAMKLKENLGIPWIADFRDPWTRVSYYNDLKLTKWADRKHKRLERSVLQSADKCVAVGWKMKADYEEIGGREVEVVTNGFDIHSSEKEKITYENPSKLSILYLGSLSRKRNPILFWESIAELIKENHIDKSAIEIKFVGNIESSVFESLDELGLNDIYTKQGYVPHEEVWKFYAQASVLLLIGIPNKPEILPGKFFEYLASQKPIYSIFPEHSDVEKIMKECKSGLSADFGDKITLKSNLRHFISLYHDNSLSKVYGDSIEAIEQYSRKSLTGKLAVLLEDIVVPDSGNITKEGQI